MIRNLLQTFLPLALCISLAVASLVIFNLLSKLPPGDPASFMLGITHSLNTLPRLPQ